MDNELPIGSIMNKLLLLLLLSQLAWGQAKKDLSINYMLRGYFYASSSIADTAAAGGFGGSSNQARLIDATIPFVSSGLQLFIDTTRQTTFAQEYKGHTVYLINATDSLVSLSAMDSRLSIQAEVLIDNHWKPIEYLASSWCGNSYHTLYLPAGEYWTFKAPVYTGKLKTKLRYKLMPKRRDGSALYSNQITAFINEGQLTQQQGHQATSIMDPYNR